MGPTSSPPSSTVTLLSCLDLAGADNTNHRSPISSVESLSPISLRYRHLPFLHLTRVETLDDDFLSGNDDDAHSLFGPNQIAPILIFSSSSHSTSKLGFNGTYGTRVSEIVRSSLTFKAEKFTIFYDRARGRDGDGERPLLFPSLLSDLKVETLQATVMQFQKFVVLIVLVFLPMLVSGDRENTMQLGLREQHYFSLSPNKQAEKEQENNKQQQRRLNSKHSLEAFFSSKRRVPNASDPLHNR
ncbi:hypothetical protein D8674_015318 [Pyrus ussuriensis x Pyrus communis]|uniref:Uncharacterized protein n=1 Tax=Pyrus ussuriensis x Pyrus communis TaxID=2448454 RepID=A0A5N5GV11_9ROSA|nr:hypothetical protein D8674_015318 [Pyrus ussuriensis x Pyrus communis]